MDDAPDGSSVVRRLRAPGFTLHLPKPVEAAERPAVIASLTRSRRS